MDMIKKLFPHAMQAKDVKGLIIAILIYAVVHLVGGLVLGLLDNIPLVGFVFGVLGWVLSIYCVIGIIVAILVFFNILK
ncbi:MAG: hypothetical protein IJA07_05075 [Agathobacter sp.]|nr:hypothetical protein [Agathobacter sp.]